MPLLDAVIGRCSWDSLVFSGVGVGGISGILGVDEPLGSLGVFVSTAGVECAVSGGVVPFGAAFGFGVGEAVPDVRGEPDPVVTADLEVRGEPDTDKVGEAEGSGVGVGVGVGTG